MTAETKLRTLAAASTDLQAFFGTNPFRWFSAPLPPGFVMRATGTTCARVQQIGTEFIYFQDRISSLAKARFQVTILDPNIDVVEAATDAVLLWLQTIDLASSNQFDSPPTSAPQLPMTFIQNVYPVREVNTKPVLPGKMIDFKAWNIGLN